MLFSRQALPAISTVAAGNFSDFKGADRVVTVAFLSEDDSANLASFTTVAEKNRDDFLFGLSRDPEVAKTAGVTPPAVVLYRKFDEPEIKFDKSFEPAGLEAFIKAESIPLIDEIGPENFAAYAESGLPLAYYFTEPDAADKESALEALKPLAKEHKGKVNFVWIDAVKFAQHAKGLNLQEEKFPAL